MKKKPALPLSGLCVVIALMAACGTELDRTNAYDQMTAAEQQATGALLGRVQLEGEHDYAGVDVRVDGPVQGSVASGADGSFAINQLIPGTYKVVLSSRGFEEITYPTLTIGLGASVQLDTVGLPLRKATVRGSVTSTAPDLVQPAGSVVNVVRIASPHTASLAVAYASAASQASEFALLEAQAVVDNDGTFVLPDVGAGTYSLTLLGQGAAAVSSEFTVSGDVQEIDLGELELNALTGTLAIVGTLGTGEDSGNYTASRDVRLQLLGFNANSMQIGERTADLCEYKPTEPYTVDRSYKLSAGDGPKSVCARFISSTGNRTPDIVRTIYLDTQAPSLTSVMLDGGAAKNASHSGTVALSIASTDLGSGLAGLQIGNSLTQARAADLLEPDSVGSWILAGPLGAGQSGNRSVTVIAVDLAGNASSPLSDTIEYDTVPPVGSASFPVATTSATVITVATTYSSDTVEMSLTRGNSCSSAEWLPASTIAPWSLAPGETLQSVAVQFRDDAGNTSACYTDQIELDIVPPDPPALQVFDTTGDGFAYSANDIELRWSKPTGTAYFELQRLISGLDDGFTYVTQLVYPQDTYVDAVTQPGYLYYYRIRAVDALHNASAWSIVADALPFEPITQIGWIMNEGAMQFNFAPNTGVFGITGTYNYFESDAWLNTYALAANQTTWVRPTSFSVEPFEETLTLRTANQDSSLVYDSAFELPKSRRNEVIAASATISGTPIVALDRYDQPSAMWTNGSGFQYSYRAGGIWYTSTVPGTAGGLTLGDFAVDSFGMPHFVYRNGTNVYYGKRSSSVISDTFETAYKTQHWQSSPTCTIISTEANNEFSGVQSMRVGGGGVVQNALTLSALTSQSQLYYNYRFQRADGAPDAPEGGDALAFEYYNGSVWSALQYHTATAGSTTGWTYASGFIPSNATAVRFRNASDGGCAADFFFVEDVSLYGSSSMWITWLADAATGLLPRLALDSANNAHIVYGRTTPEMRHLTNATGSWVIQQAYNAMYASDQFDLAVDGSDRVHIIGSAGLGDVYHSIRSAAGVWGSASLVYNTAVSFTYFDVSAGIQNKLSVCMRDYVNNVIYRGNYSGSAWSFGSTGMSSYSACAASALTISRDSATAHAARVIAGTGTTSLALTAIDSNVGVARTLDQLNAVAYFDAQADSLGTSHIVHYGPGQNALLYSVFQRGTNSATDQLWTRYNLTTAGATGRLIHLPNFGRQAIAYNAMGSYYAYDTGDGWKHDPLGGVATILDATATYDGTVHMCAYGDFDNRLMYVTNQNGFWEEEDLTSDWTTECRIAYAGGTVYIAYMNDSDSSLYTIDGNLGSWNTPQVALNSIGSTFNLSTDEDEYVHLVYEDLSGLMPQYGVCELTQGCSATADQVLSQLSSGNSIDVEARYSGDLHVAYRRSSDNSLWYARRLYGNWTHTQITDTGDAGQQLYLTLDNNDNPHILYLNSTRLGYATSASGFWQTSILAGPGTGDSGFTHFALSFDMRNYATVSWITNSSSTPVMLRGNLVGALSAVATERTTPF